MSIASRLAQIQKDGGHSASSFADILGIQRSGLSHIYSGRNKPSIDFIQKLLEAFPEYNAAWVINGTLPVRLSDIQAKMVANSAEKTLNLPKEPSLFDMVESENPAHYATSGTERHAGDKEGHKLEKSKSNRQLRQIIMIYDDNTFESFVQGI